MRRAAILLSCLLCPAFFGAPPVGAEQPSPRSPFELAQFRAQAQNYAELVQIAVNEISESYVRPVAPEDLLTAGLSGLYESVQVTAPADLRERVRRALKDGGVAALLVKTREGLGNGDVLQGNKALLATCRGMMRVLDPHCAVVTDADRRTLDVTEHNFGVGLELVPNIGVGPLVVKAVVPGGPAQRIGVQAGDRITRVNAKDVPGITSDLALATLNGPPPSAQGEAGLLLTPGLAHAGTSVTVDLERDGAAPRRAVTLLRESFRPDMVLGVTRRTDNAWDYWLDRKRRVAQVRLGRLGHGAAEDLQHVLYKLNSGEGLGGLILDLRWCPGGYLNEALCCAALLLPEGATLATVKDRAEETRTWKAGDPSLEGQQLLLPVTRYRRFPVVVLVNGDTAGGGELIAAALRDHGRAVLAGLRTRGKGSIQRDAPLSLPGFGLKLSTGLFLAPSGRNLHRFTDSAPGDDWGVRPDAGLELRVTAELGRQLRDWWEEQTARPGSSAKALPLDDPLADPQRRAALRKVHEMLDKRN